MSLKNEGKSEQLSNQNSFTTDILKPSKYLSHALRMTMTIATGLGLAYLLNTETNKYPLDAQNIQAAPLELENTSLQWANKNPMPSPRCCFGAAATASGEIYIVGGVKYGGPTGGKIEAGEMFKYNPTLDKWTNEITLPTPRESLEVAIGTNNKLYAVGGDVGGTVYNLVEEYDLVQKKWTTKTPMITPRSNFGLITGADGKLYAFGGFSRNMELLDTVEAYDPLTDKWEAKASMPTARWVPGAALGSNSKIYALGGWQRHYLTTNESYDPISNTWVSKASMTRGLQGIAVASLENRIYVAGGYSSGSSNLDEVNAYDINTDTWHPQTSLITGRSNLGMVQVGNTLYAIGGFETGVENGFSTSYKLSDKVEAGTLIEHTPTATSTKTATPTATETFSPTPTATETSTPLPTQTKSPTPTISPTLTPEPSSTSTKIPNPTSSPVFTSSPTETSSPTPSASATPQPDTVFIPFLLRSSSHSQGW